MPSSKYKNVSIPTPMVEEILKKMEENPQLGFSGHTEFVKHAIRVYLDFLNSKTDDEARP